MTGILLRGGTVITMAADRPDAERLDILVEDGRIAAIAEHLETTDAETIDFSGRILMPGLVNAHLHSWEAALRCIGSDWTLLEYLAKMHGGLASHYLPEDMHIAALACALNQINCGTTTLGDWSHNARTPEHADATIQGLVESGIRALYFHGTSHTLRERVHPAAEIDRLLAGPIARHDLIDLGMAIPGPQLSSAKTAIADFLTGRDRGLVVSMHQSAGRPGASWEAVRDAGLIGPLTNIVHGNDIPDEWIRIFVDAGATFTITPEVELGQGHGFPVTGRLLRLGVAPSLGTDVDTVVSGEVLIAARIALAQQRCFDHEQQRRSTGLFSPTATIASKQALAWSTIEGARALGLADRIGSLAPGMQADLIAIDTRALNLWPAHDPIAAALQASIANVEAVMIAGRWRKRDHTLVGVDVAQVRDRLAKSGDRLLGRIEPHGLVGRLREQVVLRVVHRMLKRHSRV